MFVGDQCGKAEEAINFYVSLFPNSQVESMQKWQAGEQGGVEGMVKQAVFTLADTQYMASENPMDHKFSFTPAVSIFVTCQTGEELQDLFTKLSDGGSIMMPLGDYGFGKQFGWVADKYGMSWQLNLPS